MAGMAGAPNHCGIRLFCCHPYCYPCCFSSRKVWQIAISSAF